MEKNLPSMNPLLKIWMPSFSLHIPIPHGKEDSMKTPMGSSDSTSRKKLTSTISRFSKSSRWWKNSITVQENAWEWKHQISYSSRIIHLSHFGVESALNYFFLYQHILSPSASVFFRGLITQVPWVDALLVLISHLHSSAGLAPSLGHPKFPQVFVYLISHTCLYFRRKYHE